MHYHRILRQFYNRPLLVMPDTAHVLSDLFLARGFGGAPASRGRSGMGEDDAGESMTYFPAQARGDGTVEAHAPRASRFHGDIPLSDDGARRPLPYRRTTEGTAIITLVGEWVNRGAWIGASSGVISYEGFKYAMSEAAEDRQVRSILIDLESPGGEAVGAFEAAQMVRDVAAVKPVVAMVNGMAASAAYAIASACSSIISIPTGISGSIGVVMMHLDISEHLAKEGMKPTFIHAGAHKVEGNPYEALPEAVRDRFQADIDRFYGMFIETVSAGRPNLTEQAIRGTEAACFMGRQALDAGLVDDLGSFEEVLAELDAGRPPVRLARAAPVLPAPASSPSLSTKESNVTDEEENRVRLSERSRLKAILGSPEALGREAQALALAVEGVSLQSAEAILRASPKADSLDARMAGRTPLDLDPEAPAGAKKDPKTEAAPWSDIVSSLNAKAAATEPNFRAPRR